VDSSILLNKLQHCRTLLCERGLLQRADGSARWSQDKTSVLAAVYGPRTTLGRKEDSEQAVVEVVFKPKSGMYRYNAPGMFRLISIKSLLAHASTPCIKCLAFVFKF